MFTWMVMDRMKDKKLKELKDSERNRQVVLHTYIVGSRGVDSYGVIMIRYKVY